MKWPTLSSAIRSMLSDRMATSDDDSLRGLPCSKATDRVLAASAEITAADGGTAGAQLHEMRETDCLVYQTQWRALRRWCSRRIDTKAPQPEHKNPVQRPAQRRTTADRGAALGDCRRSTPT